MNHLAEEQLYEYVFEQHSLSESETAHLGVCTACQQQERSLQLLRQTLLVARRSHVSTVQQERYYQLLSHVQQRPSRWERWFEQVQMALMLDSRQRMGLQGLRNSLARSYRLLYSANAADVELLVELQGQVRHIEGEIMVMDGAQLQVPVLVELLAADRERELNLSAESTLDGRFQLPGVTLGYYDLVITPTEGPFLQIKGIDIT